MTSVGHVARAWSETRPAIAHGPTRRRTGGVGAARVGAIVVASALVLGACGGDDDDESAETTTTTTVAAPSSTTTTTAAPATTTTTTTTLALVTEGAIVVVANASGINGAAGRLSDRLAAAGFTTGTATNSTEGQLETSKVYYDPANESAKAVADSLRLALGGGSIEVLEMGVPAPVESGDIGDASIVVAMGNDIADRSLEELQGIVTTTTAAATDSSTPASTDAPD
jgi:hypothetical protein